MNEEYLWKWIIQIGFDVYGFDQNAKEDQESIEKASQFCKILLIMKEFIFIQSIICSK